MKLLALLALAAPGLAASCSVINAPEDAQPTGAGSGGGAGGGQGGGTTTTASTGGGQGGMPGCTGNADCADMSTACAPATCIGGECVGQQADDGTPCDDELFCTEVDSCQDGVCTGTPRACPGAACETGSCDEDANACATSPITACTANDDCCPAACTNVNDNDCPFWQSGVLVNIPPAALENWTECYSGTFDQSFPLTSILTACSKAKLLMACRPVGSPNFSLVAMAPREDVLFDCGQTVDCTKQSNGVGWYFDEDYSWGFAPGGAPVNRISCDCCVGGPESFQDQRMCSHTGAGELVSGYRCGNVDAYGAHERFIFHAD